MPVIECISPVDGSVYAARESLNLAAAQGVASRARKAQKAWARRPLEDRIQLVMKGVARLNEMTDEVVPELAWQMGRPVRYGGEFKGFNERVNYVAGIAGSSLAPIVIEHSDQFERGIEREPHGVVFVIAPWNYPYMTAINTVAPALMAGNSVILKHSSQTLLVGERLVRAFNEAGVPEDVFQNVFLDHDVTSALIAARCFDFVNFTGSVEGGRSIERAAAGTFTSRRARARRQRPGLRHGGRRPRCRRRYADGWRDLQFRAVLLRHRAHLCDTRSSTTPSSRNRWRGFRTTSSAIRSIRKRRSDRWPTSALPRRCRSQIRDAVAKGAKRWSIRSASRPTTEAPIVAPQILVNVDHSMDLDDAKKRFGPDRRHHEGEKR